MMATNKDMEALIVQVVDYGLTGNLLEIACSQSGNPEVGALGIWDKDRIRVNQNIAMAQRRYTKAGYSYGEAVTKICPSPFASSHIV